MFFFYVVKSVDICITRATAPVGHCKFAARFEQSFCVIVMFAGSENSCGVIKKNTKHRSTLRCVPTLVVADCCVIRHAAPLPSHKKAVGGRTLHR